jgi:toxin YoeB
VKVTFSSRAWAEYLLWQKSDPKLLDKVNSLIEECSRDPFRGTGKPEPLGGNLSSRWSRRINGEHRLVYRVSGKGDAQSLDAAQCQYRY